MAEQQQNLVSDSEWEEFKLKFSKTYKDETDEKNHREIYAATKQRIAEHNKKFETGEVTFSMGINQFADMSRDEHRNYMGVIKPDGN